MSILLLGGSAQELPAQAAEQAGIPVLGLEDCVALALAEGPELKVAAASLDAARAAHDLNLSKAGLSLSTSGNYGLGEGFSLGTPSSPPSSLLSRASGSGGAPGLTQTIQGGLTLSSGNASASSPATRLALSATQVIPPAGGTSAPTTTVNASFAQTVWDGYPGGQTKAVIDKSALALRGRETQAAAGRATVVANVKKAYMTMLSAQRTLALRLEILGKQQALLAQMNAVYALKQASSIDLLGAQINAKTAVLDVESARHDLALASQRLSNLMGRDPSATFAVADIPDEPAPAASVDEAISVGLSRRSELALAELSRRSAAIDLALARGLSQPGVSLTSGLGLSVGAADGSAQDAEYASLGVKLTLPVLDGGAAQAQERSSRATMAMYDAQERQLRLTIAADIRDAFWTVSIMAQKVELARQGMELYESQLALVKIQNSFGTATNQDLLAASVNAANAAAAHAAARTSYLLAVLALETAMGL